VPVYQVAPNLPLLVLAGRAKPGLVVKAISQGAQDCLFKDTMTMAELGQAARSAIARHQFYQSVQLRTGRCCGRYAAHSDANYLKTLAQPLPDDQRCACGEFP